MQVVIMDDVRYNIGIEYESMERSFSIIEGNNAGTDLTGRYIRDILGSGYSYEMTFVPLPGYETDYDRFFYDLAAPKEYRMITFPFGQSTITFEAKVTSAKDTYGGNYAGTQQWKGLKVKFEHMGPQRIV